MFHGGFHMMRKFSLAALLGSALLLSGCVTPYVSGSIGTRIGSGGYIGGTVGGYPYGYGGYGRYNRYGYGHGYGYGGYGYGTSIYGYDRYGNPIYRLPDGRLVPGGPGNYYRGYPGYGYRGPSYGYPRHDYGYPGYGYPRNQPPGYYRPPADPHDPPPVARPGGDSGVPSQPVTRSRGGSSSGDVLRQARERAKHSPPIEP